MNSNSMSSVTQSFEKNIHTQTWKYRENNLRNISENRCSLWGRWKNRGLLVLFIVSPSVLFDFLKTNMYNCNNNNNNNVKEMGKVGVTWSWASPGSCHSSCTIVGKVTPQQDACVNLQGFWKAQIWRPGWAIPGLHSLTEVHVKGPQEGAHGAETFFHLHCSGEYMNLHRC